MNLVMKRKMIEVLRGVIGSGHEGNQEDLIAILHSKGFIITQSTISRALKKIGAIKISLESGGSRYELKSNTPIRSYGGSLSSLILSINSNETMIVIKTTPGAAMFVAGFFDHYCRDFILGTIAGDDAIFCIPSSNKKIKSCEKSIETYISKN